MLKFSMIVSEMRPRQWIKNHFIFAPLIFSHNFTNPEYLKKSFLAFLIFSFIAGMIYIINDCADLKSDKNHPVKMMRPIASGKISRSASLLFAIISLTILFFISFLFDIRFFFLSILYIVINILYTLVLKRIAVLDVMIIAVGFVIRVMIGGEINGIYLSPWIFIMTFLLALFLGLVKRRQELVAISNSGKDITRYSLRDYSIPFLDQLISITTSATLISYIIYVVNPDVQNYFHSQELFLTVPFVIFGIFRYLYLTYVKSKGEVPEEILFSDFPFMINLLLWIAVFFILIYF